MYNARILADSVNYAGVRMFTVEATFPRIVLAENNTHRMLSKNAASSRAIPVEKMLTYVKEDPFMPVYWGMNQAGMQASQELSDSDRAAAEKIILRLRDQAIEAVEMLTGKKPINRRAFPKKDNHVTERYLNLHKQTANRYLEPWMWVTVVMSGTEWANYFSLRCHKDAQPEIREIAERIADLYYTATPIKLAPGKWHLPLCQPEDLEALKKGEITIDELIKACVGRVARVSYLTHDGRRDISADIALHDRLTSSLPKHMSPTEHIALAMRSKKKFYGNLRGFNPYRKMVSMENITEFDYEAYKAAKEAGNV